MVIVMIVISGKFIVVSKKLNMVGVMFLFVNWLVRGGKMILFVFKKKVNSIKFKVKIFVSFNVCFIDNFYLLK